MTAARAAGGQPVVLSAEEAAMVRQALADCSRMLTWASGPGGPQAGQLLAGMTRQLPSRRSAPGVLHDINLAIDYLDFAPAARSWR